MFYKIYHLQHHSISLQNLLLNSGCKFFFALYKKYIIIAFQLLDKLIQSWH